MASELVTVLAGSDGVGGFCFFYEWHVLLPMAGSKLLILLFLLTDLKLMATVKVIIDISDV